MSPRGPFSFEEAVWRELDQMRQALEKHNALVERAVDRFQGEVDEIKDEVSQVKISVAELRRDPPRQSNSRGLVRDGGLTISGATVGALIAALAQYLATPAPHLNPPQPAPPTAPHVQPAPIVVPAP